MFNNRLKFKVTKEQQKQINILKENFGEMDYIFYFTEDGKYHLKVKIWNTGEYINL